MEPERSMMKTTRESDRVALPLAATVALLKPMIRMNRVGTCAVALISIFLVIPGV